MNQKQNNCPRGHHFAMARYRYNPTRITQHQSHAHVHSCRPWRNVLAFPQTEAPFSPAVAIAVPIPMQTPVTQTQRDQPPHHDDLSIPTPETTKEAIPHSPDRPLVLRRLSVKLRRILSPQADSSNTSNAFCRSTAELPARLLPSRLPLSSGLIEPSWPHLSPPASENDGR